MLMNTLRGPFTDPRALSVQCSPLGTQPYELQLPYFPDSQLHLLNSGFLTSMLQARNSFSAVSRHNCRAHSTGSLSFRHCCPLLPDIQCLENGCIYFVWVFFFFSVVSVRKVNKARILAECRNHLLIFSKILNKFFKITHRGG